MPAPLVSVVIPAYQASSFIAATLASVFNQTYTTFEVLLVEDGSPDRAALEHAIEPYRGRIRYLPQPNRGAGAARNVGIRCARGEWLAFLDADDRWLPRFLECQAGQLAADPSLDLVYADAILTGQSPMSGRRFSHDAPSRGPVTLESLLLQRCNVLTSSVVVRRRAVQDVGCFDEQLRRGQDYDLWLRLAHAGARLGYTREALVIRRIHEASLSGDSVTQFERVLAVLGKVSRFDLDAQARSAVTWRMRRLNGSLALERGKRGLVAGQYREAADWLRTAAGLAPGWRLRTAAAAARWAPGLLATAYRLLSPGGHAEARRTASSLPPAPVQAP